MKNIFNLLVAGAFLMIFSSANAQVKTPAASPGAKIEQSVGLSTISLDYSRPSAKGRKVMGDLVPYGQLWRTGANQGTKVTFSDDVKVNGVDLKKGKYSLFTLPGATEWKVIFHKDAGLSTPGGDNYKESDEAARISVVPTAIPNHVETFSVGFSNLTDNTTEMYIAWEKTRVGFTVDVMTDAKVVASITQALAGPSANDYMAAANYYSNSGKDINKALEWGAKAVSMGANQFWNLRGYSLILAKAGKYTEAIAVAKESLTKATEAKNNDYIKMNNESIAMWSKK
ncbi:MAG: DUF2911 domain-containing protein [Saprospiraceae bacterium]|jgi:hypothetical protein|nr:DUF2911 domain-containing protein [Saprospiraceae bacterium]MBP6448007.1 DUF2911 domain-containing protein [Saprospiraceae bacterium]